jgi:hypothetical protein
MIPDSDWHRFTYWLGQNWPGVVQAACAAVTVGVTYSLARMNRRYVELTRELVDNAQRQTRLLVQPNLDISSLVEGLEYAPGRKFYRARITVKNKGAYPVQITEAHVSGGGVR